MKLRLLLISFITLLFGYTAHAQVTLDNTMTVEELVNNVLLGQGVTASNVMYNGQPGNEVSVQVGNFTMDDAGTVFPIDSGVVMSTSNLQIVNEGGTGGNDANFPNFSDPDLVSIAGFNINNAAVIEFDFTAGSDSLKFDYIFASAEYPNYTCSSFNDVFGFFLSGPGINGPYANNAINIALIPDTDVPVGVNSVNSGFPQNDPDCLNVNPNYMDDSVYFISNDPPTPNSIQIRGHTVTLPAFADIDCGATYHIKLAIGNSTDQSLQSAVFLKAGSFAAFGDVFLSVSPTIGGSAVANPDYDSVLVAGCSEAYIELIRPGGLTIDSVWVEFGGTAIQQIGDIPIPGADYELTTENDSIELGFPEGVDTISFVINTIWDSIPDENEYIVISIFYYDGCGELNSASDTIYIVDPYFLASNAPPVDITCPADQVLVMAEGLDGIEPYYYDWIDIMAGEELTEVMVDVPPDSAYYVVGISDQCAFEVKYDSVLVTNSIPPPLQATIDEFADPECTNEPVLLNATIQDGNGDYTIVWSDGKENTYVPNESITVQNINSTIIFNPDPMNYTAELPVYLTVIDTCGTIANDTIHINYPFFEPLKANFTPLTQHCPTEPVIVTSASEFGAGDYYYNWELINGKFGQGADPNASTIHVEQSGGMNTYTLTVTDFCERDGYSYNYVKGDDGELLSSGLAVYSDSVRVIKLDKIMNVITPNGDNKNDFFAIEGIEEFDDARLEVYDRWGKLIYETDNYMAGMPDIKTDNAFDGDGFGDGTYFYIINVESGECVTSGSIEVLRNNN